MTLTKEQLDILNHCVLDGQVWFDHAMSLGREDAVQAKIDKYRQSYLDEKDKPDYKTCQQKEDAKIQEEQDHYDNVSWDVKRMREYPHLQECIHAILDDELDALQAKRKLVKDKYPKE